MIKLCPLFSGSSGNSTFIDADGTRLLVDAGVACRSIVGALKALDVVPESISAVLITHEHSDHIRGLGAFVRKFGVPVYANAETWNAFSDYIGEIPPNCVRIFETDRDFYLGRVNVLPFKTPHDAAESVGYCFESGYVRVGVATDMGHISERAINAIQGVEALVFESNHDVDMLKKGSYPYPLKRRILGTNGHLSNEDCAKALVKLYSYGLKGAILAHLSDENNTEEVALETVRAILREEDIFDQEFSLDVAHPSAPNSVLCAEGNAKRVFGVGN